MKSSLSAPISTLPSSAVGAAASSVILQIDASQTRAQAQPLSSCACGKERNAAAPEGPKMEVFVTKALKKIRKETSRKHKALREACNCVLRE